MRRIPVCALDDIPPGSMKLVSAGKFGIGVYNVHGKLYAIANYCLHEGAPLCAGPVRGKNEFAPDVRGGVRQVLDGQILRCPWHQWEYDLATGENLADPQRRIRIYPVDVIDGEVFVTA